MKTTTCIRLVAAAGLLAGGCGGGGPKSATEVAVAWLEAQDDAEWGRAWELESPKGLRRPTKEEAEEAGKRECARRGTPDCAPRFPIASYEPVNEQDEGRCTFVFLRGEAPTGATLSDGRVRESLDEGLLMIQGEGRWRLLRWFPGEVTLAGALKQKVPEAAAAIKGLCEVP